MHLHLPTPQESLYSSLNYEICWELALLFFVDILTLRGTNEGLIASITNDIYFGIKIYF